MAKRSRYRDLDDDPDVVRQHAEKTGDWDKPIKSKYKVFTPKEGKNRIRIIGRTWNDDRGPRHWAFNLPMHFDVGPDNARYPCPNKLWGDSCPMCDERTTLDAEGDAKGAKKLRPSTYRACWIVDRDAMDDGPQIFLMPAKKLEANICDLSRDPDTGALIKIHDPDNGHDVGFTRVGKTKESTEYGGVRIYPKSSYLSEDEDEQIEWLNFVVDNPIPDCIARYSTEYLEKVFGGVSTSSRRDKDEDEDEDDAPAPRTRRDRARSRSRDEDEADEDAEEPRRTRRQRREAVEDEEEEEAPRARGRGSRSAVEEDEEPAPRGRRSRSEPADEDEAEPAPRSKRGRRSEPIDDPDEELDEPEDEPEPPRGRRKRSRIVVEEEDESGEPDEDAGGGSRGTRTSRRGSRGDLREEVTEGLRRRRRSQD